MNFQHPLMDIVTMQKNSKPIGICSICSANEYVIEAAMEKSLHENSYVLIESTSNQVNQFGGYTGMRPADFREFVFSIASKAKFPFERIILGGDHLGPFPWKTEKACQAMMNAAEMIREYIVAGFTKIHIDTSMLLADDINTQPLDPEIIAERGAFLCAAAEEEYKKLRKLQPNVVCPVYVVGSEVPIPGGSIESEEAMKVTKSTDFEHTIEMFKKAFNRYNLNNVWERVIGVVVQPGVEFGDDTIHDYSSEEAMELCRSLRKYPGIVFEGHSTDYQNASALKNMVKDGIAILKVGPALTFAMREALFMLNYIENEIFRGCPGVTLSEFINTLIFAMDANPENWKKYYHGDEKHISLSKKFSYSDRCRYYLHVSEVLSSMKLLIENLKAVEIPMTLISQFLPVQYKKIRTGLLKNDPESLIKDKIMSVLDDYCFSSNY